MNNLIDNCLKFVKEFFVSEVSGHDYFHTLRVYNLAKTICNKEDANEEIVSLVALLHDVDDRKISPETTKNKDNARKFLLENNVSKENIEFICTLIGEISYKGNESKASSTLEGRIVQDADRLDAIGAIGVARAFAYGGNHNRVMHDPNELPKLNMNEEEYKNHVSTTLNHFYEKLFNLKELMNTDTAKELAISREKYMKEFVDRFLEEWDGVK